MLIPIPNHVPGKPPAHIKGNVNIPFLHCSKPGVKAFHLDRIPVRFCPNTLPHSPVRPIKSPGKMQVNFINSVKLNIPQPSSHSLFNGLRQIGKSMIYRINPKKIILDNCIKIYRQLLQGRSLHRRNKEQENDDDFFEHYYFPQLGSRQLKALHGVSYPSYKQIFISFSQKYPCIADKKKVYSRVL